MANEGPKEVFCVDEEKQQDEKNDEDDDEKNDEETDGKNKGDDDKRRAKATTKNEPKKAQGEIKETKANEKDEQPKPSKRKPKPTKPGDKTKQPKPSKEKPKPQKANEKDEQPKPSKKKPKPTMKADEMDEQPHKKAKIAEQTDEVIWSNLHEKATCNGEMSSSPYVEGGEVLVRFKSGRVWRVPHLVPKDIEQRGEQAALPRVGDVSEVKKKKPRTEAKPRPVSDFILGSVRVKYASQGSKHPILKLECKEDRFGPSAGPWRQKMQFVLKEDAALTMAQASHVLQTMAMCYEKMNLNGAEIDFKRCRDSLLKHAEAVKHDWEKKPMSWEYVNKQKLDGFPLARLGRSCIVFWFRVIWLSVRGL